MSLSGDEDDFQSADEEGFGEDLKTLDQAAVESNRAKVCTKGNKNSLVDKCKNDSSDQNVIEALEVKPLESSPANRDTTQKEKPVGHQKDKEGIVDDKCEADDNGDEEDAVVERVRERNLKIARKFSAELARNIKASAPIPFKGASPPGFKVSDIEYPIIESDATSSPPPPPPTPALSSSFNSEEPTSSPSIGGTQYGWRVPAKVKPNQSGAADTSPSSASKSDQARLTLDRLSEKLSQSDKSLFERVADDLKKVSIKPGDATVPEDNSSTAGIPLIYDLTDTLSNWNWNSASRFLASASKITSQVSSVIDSVVNASQQPPISEKSHQQQPSSTKEATVSTDIKSSAEPDTQ